MILIWLTMITIIEIVKYEGRKENNYNKKRDYTFYIKVVNN